MYPAHASLPLEAIDRLLFEEVWSIARLLGLPGSQPPPQAQGLTETEIWWHICGITGDREYRANGWPCSQCGASGPDKDAALFAFATGLARMPRARA